uniref:Uncharacterized protein n=1 Tax=Ciceribacter selenitireducens ATCC BAA-1503 TaxID=1336235 RepID=A0A380TML6_9HYPH|nr:unnamed protein product [Ciceribacter selenitireducens ATCC BAA-1503]
MLTLWAGCLGFSFWLVRYSISSCIGSMAHMDIIITKGVPTKIAADLQ